MGELANVWRGSAVFTFDGLPGVVLVSSGRARIAQTSLEK
jgi:hypothetical protein